MSQSYKGDDMMKTSLLITAVATIFSTFADLPSGYKQLEYIDTDGNQWVNTRFLPACTNAVEIKASFTNTATGSAQYLFCSQRKTDGTDRRIYSLNISSNGRTEFRFRNSAGGNVLISPSVPYVFSAVPDKTDIYTEVEDAYFLTGYVDGKQAGTKVAGKDFIPDAQAYFCLFGHYTGSLTDEEVPTSRAVCRFWYCKHRLPVAAEIGAPLPLRCMRWRAAVYAGPWCRGWKCRDWTPLASRWWIRLHCVWHCCRSCWTGWRGSGNCI
jgi:hypothetical protein